MAQIVTSLPWLNNNQDPVATYQRSQQLVQQMQAQQAQERQQQAELAQRAQEAAMQAQFQQRSLALKEQEAKSAVQVEADRLRQKGQALEFENQARQAEQRYLQAPPQLMEFGDGTRGVKYRGSYHPLQRPGAFAGMVNTAVPVMDPSGKQVGYNAITGENSSTFRQLQPDKPSAETVAAQKQAQADQKFSRSRLLAKEKELSRLQPGTKGGDAIPDEPTQLKAVRDYIAIKKEIDSIAPGESAASPLAAAAPVGVRIRRKSDGKILRYKGNRADVPTKEFDIVE